MSTATVAQQLVEFCQQGQNTQAVETLYANDAVSVEAADSGSADMPREMRGLDTLRKKNQWWIENHEVHSASTEGPYPHGDDRFAAIFEFDVTHKPSGQRMQMKEVGVFTVANDKITREEFFYATPDQC